MPWQVLCSLVDACYSKRVVTAILDRGPALFGPLSVGGQQYQFQHTTPLEPRIRHKR